MSVVIVPDCYENIVGLSRTNCECYEIPSDAETSLSGLYIDELTSLSFISAINDCENNNDVWEQLAKSRQIAIATFQADVNALLMKHHRLRRANFKGSIGRAIAKNNITQTTGEYYGVRIYCANVKSGYIKINRIGAMFKSTGALDLLIYNNLGELIESITLNTTANTINQNTVSIELPLHSDYVENLEYFLIYQSGANKCMGNDLKCNCGGFKATYNTLQPYFLQPVLDRNYMWAQWVMVGGFHSASLPDFSSCSTSSNNYMYGLTFDVELKCSVNEVLCADGLDFESNNLAGAMALAIQYKSGATLARWIVNSGKLNRFTMINTEQLLEDIKEWDSLYNSMTTFIADEADTSVNDCLVCKDFVEMVKRGILA